jgi:ketosteroid isomerase-like protein
MSRSPSRSRFRKQCGPWLRFTLLTAVLSVVVAACGSGSAGGDDLAADDSVAPSPTIEDAAGDHSAVSAVVERFHAALESGDSLTAVELLQPSATILEAGGVETREEYRAGHLPADIEFAQALRPVRAVIQVSVEGGMAWAVSESIVDGEMDGATIRSQGAELMILSRTDEGWKIEAIHWSSRPITN